MDKMRVCMASREYYYGEITLSLPFGLVENDIEDVQPDGYGQFWVFLEKSGKEKIKGFMENNDHEFQEHEFRSWCKMITLDDWNIVKMSSTGEIILEWRGEIDMEFDEVDENMVTHWEVEDGGA